MVKNKFINKTKNTLNNEKGNSFLYLLILVIFVVSISALLLDVSNLYIKSKKIKYAINRATLAGALQIEEEIEVDGEMVPSTNLADGIFKIDEEKAEDAFVQILATNIGLNEDTLEPLEKSLVYEKPIIRELEVQNDVPATYTSLALNRSYELEHPSMIAVLDFKVRGIFIERRIRVYKLSSSQLTTIYE